MRSFIVALAALAFATSASAAPNCKVGVPCGNTCIAKGKVCHVTTPPAPKHCKDPKTHKFVKCGTAGAVPA